MGRATTAMIVLHLRITNNVNRLQLLIRTEAKLMGAWFLYYPGQSWILFQPEQVVEEPLCEFPRAWWEKQRRSL